MQTQPYGSQGTDLGMQPHAEGVAPALREEAREMAGKAGRKLEAFRARASTGIPARPLLGVLPLARVVPQDVHSVADYTNGVSVGLGLLSDDPRARIASGVLAASILGVSSMTDYRLSVAKVIPIETHEVLDHLWGLSAIAAPFVLGYWKTSPKVAFAHMVSGLSTIVASLLTDYRAARGVGR